MTPKTAVKLTGIGLKVTPQRRAILKFLDGNRNHPSAHAIYHALIKQHPNMSFATVYNTLAKLVERGEIQELDIDPDKKRFDSSTVPHGHFFCQECGTIFDIELESFQPQHSIQMTIKELYGHSVGTYWINFKGICKDCGSAAKV